MRKWFVALALLALSTAPAQSQNLDSMSGPQLVTQLKALVTEFKETEAILEENAAAAEQNRAELAALNEESERLSAATADYDEAVAAHNRAVEAYGRRCLGKKLPENQYTECWAEKERLQEQKRALDQRAERLRERHAAYNRNVAEFNRRETARAEAAGRLLEAFREADEKIRYIQVRLYELATRRPEEGFAEQNRQCTLRSDLDQVAACFERAWNNLSG